MQDADLSILIQNAGIALLTIFVPVGIYIFGGNNSVLDKKIIVKGIVKGELIFLGAVLIYGPLLFWNDNLRTSEKWFLYALSLSGFIIVIRRIFLCYKWIIKDNKQDVRLEFLSRKSLTKSELFDCWKYVWESENINIEEEKDYFKIFIDIVDFYRANENIENLDAVLKLLDLFLKNVEKRNIFFLMADENFFSAILEWHMLAWEREYNYLIEDRNTNLWVKYREISRIINAIISNFFEKILMSYSSFFFFDKFQEHINKYSDLEKSKNGRKYFYVNYFELFNHIFDVIEKSSHSHEIWNHSFLEQWKVTADNFKKNVIARMILGKYFSWAQERIIKNKDEDFDKDLDSVTTNLFPEADPVIFSDILVFLIRAWSNDRVKYFIESKKNFGYVGRAFCAFCENEENFNKDYINFQQTNAVKTIELICTIFSPRTFKDIDKYIKEAEELMDIYKDDKDKEMKRKEFLAILVSIKKYLDENKSNYGQLISEEHPKESQPVAG